MYRLVFVALVCIFVFTPESLADDAGERLMAQLKEASGGAALDAPSTFHETGTVSHHSGSSSYETWGDFHSLRSVSTMMRGNMPYTRGFDGNVAWMRGPDGSVRVDQSPEGIASAKLGTYLTIGGYFFPDRFPAEFTFRGQMVADNITYDVVSVTPEGCAQMDFWLDTETHLLKRITGQDGPMTFIGIVNRYQKVNGVHIPFDLTQTQGNQTMGHTLTTYEFIAVAPERFSPPQTGSD